jgi:hypothetical protein
MKKRRPVIQTDGLLDELHYGLSNNLGGHQHLNELQRIFLGAFGGWLMLFLLRQAMHLSISEME